MKAGKDGDSNHKLEFETEGLPEGWIDFRFGEYLTLKYGKAQPKKNRKSGNIPVYGSSGVVGHHNEFLVKGPCLVVGRKGSVGSVNYVDGSCWPLDTAYFVNDFPTHDAKFLFYLMKHMRLDRLDTSTAIPSLRRDDAYALSLPLPPLPEQHRIVFKIESIFAQIDAAKERLERLARQTSSGPGSISQLKSSVLKQAFEGKLVPQDPNDEPAEVLLRRLHKDSQRELVFYTEGLPEGWVGTKIKTVCTTKSGGTPSRGVQKYFGGSIPWIKSGELNDSVIAKCKESITEFGLNNSNAIIHPKNTVLMAMYGATVGRVSILNFEASTNQAVCAFLHSDKILITKYLFWFLKSIRSNLLSVRFGGAQKNLSQEIIKQIRIKVPPINEQRRIVQKIESIFARIDATDKFVRDSLSKLELLKKSVLKQAFEGKLVPQDPNDEPAEILLQRIKQDKQIKQKHGKNRNVK